MKTFKATKTGQYQSSAETFTGSAKEVRSYLLNEALNMRRSSRIRMGEDNVHSLTNNPHQSQLVNMASFKVKQLSNDKLIDLMNIHGVLKYNLA